MKIIFLDEYSLGGADLSAIKRLGEYTAYENTTTPEEVVERCQGAEIVIANKSPLSSEILSALPSLRFIAIAATGMNNVDLERASELGIEVRNAVGYSTHSVAEATLTAALSLRREVSTFDRYVKSGKYSSSGRLFCFDRPIGQLHGSRWAIIGMGTIGREVARLATAFGCEVRYHSLSGVCREEEYPHMESLQELLGWCDTLSIHAPLDNHSRNIITERELSMMQPHAILVNVARGGIVDETALSHAIDSGIIAGAALDVFAQEPLPHNSPLLTLRDPDRVILSPHNAWASTPSIDRLVESVATNIREFIDSFA